MELIDQAGRPVDVTGLIQHNVETPADRYLLRETIVDKVKDLFSDSAIRRALLGIEPFQFHSKREEFLTYQALRVLGLEVVLFKSPANVRDKYWPLLIVRK